MGNFDFSTVNWEFVGLLAGAAFVAALLGSLIAFTNRVAGAVIAGILLGIFFVAWNYTNHSFGLPVVKTIGLDGTPGPASGPANGPVSGQ